MPAAVGRGDAGAADLEEPGRRAARDQRLDVEFERAVEAEIALGDVLPQEAIDADEFRRAVAMAERLVDHDEMVADAVEAADVAPDDSGGRVGSSAALFEEDPIAQLLRPPDVLLRRRQARLERAGARQHRAEPGEIALAGKTLQEPAGAVRPRPRCECQRHPSVPANLLCPQSRTMFAGSFYDARSSAPGADFASPAQALDFARQIGEVEGLDQEGVESGRLARSPLVLERIGGEGDDRRRRRPALALEPTQPPRRLEAVEARHPEVHQDEIERRRRAGRGRGEPQRLVPVRRPDDLETEPARGPSARSGR